jgi:hypothetical protein
MAYTVTSWFIDQTQLKFAGPKRKFTIAGSDYSGRVVKWPSIRRSYSDIRPVNITVELANEDQELNIFRDNPLALLADGALSMGYTHASSGDELIQLYTGRIDRVIYKRGAVSVALTDKFKQFTERVVGSSNSPALYTGSNYLPSDLAWWLCTSYGGLSAITSTSNPDIDYAAFNVWADVFSGDSVFVQGRFEGPKVTEALRKIARYTDSGIWVEGDRITFARFAEAGSMETVVTEEAILDLSLSIDDSTVVNKQHVYADYDVNSRYWKLDITDTDSTSVNSYGLREEVEKDESVWYVSSATALNMAQRRVLFSSTPYEEYNVTLPLVALPRQIGEMLRINDDFLGVSSTAAWRIMEYSLDMDRGRMEVKADSSRIALPFTLDHDVYGLLDQDYNLLL